MYYHTPDMNRYLDTVIKYRLHIISFYMVLAVIMSALFTPTFLSSDALFWLDNSKQLEQTNSKSFSTHHLSKLVVHVETFDEPTRQSLQALHEKLRGLEGAF